MSSRDKARMVRAINKQEQTLERLDERIREAQAGLNKAQNTVLRLQQVKDKTQDRLDDAMEMYESLKVVDDG